MLCQADREHAAATAPIAFAALPRIFFDKPLQSRPWSLDLLSDLTRPRRRCPIARGIAYSGQRSVRLETIERLAVALRVQPSELMPEIKLPRA
jgi:hypothetical protein